MAFSGDLFTVEGGSLKLDATELNGGGTVKVDYNFQAEAAELPTYGSFPDTESLGGKRVITGTIEYWIGDAAADHITGLDVGSTMAMIHLIPSHYKFTGDVVIMNVAESYDAGSSDPVKGTIQFKVSGTPTIALGVSAT